MTWQRILNLLDRLALQSNMYLNMKQRMHDFVLYVLFFTVLYWRWVSNSSVIPAQTRCGQMCSAFYVPGTAWGEHWWRKGNRTYQFMDIQWFFRFQSKQTNFSVNLKWVNLGNLTSFISLKVLFPLSKQLKFIVIITVFNMWPVIWELLQRFKDYYLNIVIRTGVV